MNMLPVSVIVPVYNAEKTLDKCIQSILNQTFTEFELVLVNDGSTDSSLTILKEYARKDERILLIDKENEGASLSRKKGLEQASGEFVLFVDSDDYIDLDYLAVYYQAISTSQADIVIGGLRTVDGKGKIHQTIVLPTTSWAKYLIVSACTRIIRKRFLEEQKIQFINYTMEDLHFNAVMFSKTDKVVTIPYVGYNNFINPVSTTRTSHRGIRPEINLLTVFEAIHQEVPPSEEIKFFYRKNYLYYLLYSGRYSSSERFRAEHKRIVTWLKHRQLTTCKNPFHADFKGEKLLTKIALVLFSCLELGDGRLVSVFARLYCKGEQKQG